MTYLKLQLKTLRPNQTETLEAAERGERREPHDGSITPSEFYRVTTLRMSVSGEPTSFLEAVFKGQEQPVVDRECINLNSTFMISALI